MLQSYKLVKKYLGSSLFVTINYNFSKLDYEEILKYHTKKSRKRQSITEDQVVKASLWLMYFVVNLVQTVCVYSETFEGSGTQSAKSHQMWNIWRMKIKVNSLQLSVVEFPSKWMKCSTASWITEQFYCIVINKRIPFGKHCLPFQQLKTMVYSITA